MRESQGSEDIHIELSFCPPDLRSTRSHQPPTRAIDLTVTSVLLRNAHDHKTATMLRSARPLLNASARGLPKNTASIAPLGVSQTRRSTSHTTWRARVPTTASASSKQLVPFTQRALYATKNERDAAFEKEIANKELEKDPEHVTSQSSVRQFEPPVRPASGTDSKEGLKDDLVRPLRPFYAWSCGGSSCVCTDCEPLSTVSKRLSPSVRCPRCLTN